MGAFSFATQSGGSPIFADTLTLTNGGLSRLTITATGASTTYSTASGNILVFTGAANATPTSTTINFTNLSPFSTNSTGQSSFFTIQPTINSSGSAANTDLLINRTQTGAGSGLQSFLDCAISLTSFFRVDNTGHTFHSATNTAGGTTGNQTINKPSGTVNFAAAATAITVTNSTCSANSIVLAVVRTNDSTATIKNVVPAAGSFVITLTAGATAETSVGFLVLN
jgi:hypothetical protein